MTHPRQLTPAWLQGFSKERRTAMLSLAVLFVVLSIYVIYQRYLPTYPSPQQHPESAVQQGTQSVGGTAAQPSNPAQAKPTPGEADVEASRPPLTHLEAPLGETHRIVQSFGFGYSKTYGDFRLYPGIDFAAAAGDIVKAAAPGRVTAIENGQSDGLTVVIDHGSGLVTQYAGLGKATVTANATVKVGDPIGQVGKPGAARASLGPHFHFEVWLAGNPVDPTTYFGH